VATTLRWLPDPPRRSGLLAGRNRRRHRGSIHRERAAFWSNFRLSWAQQMNCAPLSEAQCGVV